MSADAPRVTLHSIDSPTLQSLVQSIEGTHDSSFLFSFMTIVIAAGILISLAIFACRIAKLRRTLSALPKIKSFRHFEIRSSSKIQIPFAFQWARTAWIVVPEFYLADAEKFRLILQHEMEHLRQRHTIWIQVIETLRAFFFWNPFVHLWAKQFEELQEFACDEGLLASRKLSTESYGRCLWEVARHSRRNRSLLVGTTCMASLSSTTLLRRRIQMLFTYKKFRARLGIYYSIMTGTALIFTAIGCAVKATSLQDHRISQEKADVLARETSNELGFSIVMDQLVLERLNRLASTPEGRRFVRDALARMKDYAPMIEKKFADNELPKFLMAIPIVESGYRDLKGPIDDSYAKPSGKSVFNVPESDSLAPGYRGAGLWMFIPETAKRYGLQVTAAQDDRLDVNKETDAAIHLLSDLHEEYHDWPLAIAAYNHGHKKVDAAIEKAGTRDAWELARRHEINRYLSGVAAAMIIVSHPDLVD